MIQQQFFIRLDGKLPQMSQTLKSHKQQTISAQQHNSKHQPGTIELNHLAQKHHQPHPKAIQQPQNPYDQLQNNEKVIPGYNFDSLFRKKSHIRSARKKNKEEAQRRTVNTKTEVSVKENRNTQKGHWSQEESKLYHWFLELHSKHFVFKHLRRTDKIFKSMASFVQTREAEQCRSHHQKMEKKYRSFYAILSKLRIDIYGSTSIDVVKADLEQNGFKVKDHTLITETELKNEDLQEKTKKEKNDSQGISNESQCDEMEQLQGSQSDLWGQNYENGLNFKNLDY